MANWVDGVLETFEQGVDDWITMFNDPTDWAIDETGGGTVNTYDTAVYKNGSHSLSVEDNDGGVQQKAYISGDWGVAQSGTYKISLWVYLSTFTNFANADKVTFYVGGQFASGGERITVSFYNNGGTIVFYVSDSGNVAGVTGLSAATWYRVDIERTQNGASTIKVYDASLSLIDTINFTGQDAQIRKHYFGLYESPTATWVGKIYIDDLLYGIPSPPASGGSVSQLLALAIANKGELIPIK